jgi:hypothetical protein
MSNVPTNPASDAAQKHPLKRMLLAAGKLILKKSGAAPLELPAPRPQTRPGPDRALQPPAATYPVNMKSKSQSGLAKNLVFQKDKTTTLLINTNTKSVLCWGQKVGEQFHWMPVEFKTDESANDFLQSGTTLIELERVIGAPVEWRKELLGPIPEPRPNALAGVTPHSIAGAPLPQVASTEQQ